MTSVTPRSRPKRRAHAAAATPLLCAALAVAAFTLPISLAITGTHFWSPPRIVIFGVAPLCLALAALWALWRGEGARRLFLAYACALGAALVAGDLFAEHEVNAIPPPPPHSANDAGVLRAEGVRVYRHACGLDFDLRNPAVRLNGHPVQPLTGVSGSLLTPDAKHRDHWRFTDQYGFNNPPGQWTPGTTVAVGDSFTFGADVPIGKGYVDRLREREGRVVNLGCSGNGPLLELAGLAEYGALVRPAVVLWVYYEGNDLLVDMGAERASPILPGYLSAGFTQRLAEQQGELDAAIIAFLDRAAAGRSARSRTDVVRAGFPLRLSRRNLELVHLRRALGLSHRYPPVALDDFRHVLTRAKDLASGWGGRIVFVYLPDEPRYAGALGPWDAEAYAGPVRDMAAGLGFPVIDLAPVFARQANPRALFRGHYTEEGYALVGDTIADELARLRP